jgi:hypothetical protein
VGLKLNGTHQLLVCADDENLGGDNINSTKKNKEALTNTCKEVGLEVNTEKTKYTLMSRHKNAGQNHNIKIGDRSFENVANQNLSSSRLLSRNITIIIYRTTILPMVLHGLVSEIKGRTQTQGI